MEAKPIDQPARSKRRAPRGLPPSHQHNDLRFHRWMEVSGIVGDSEPTPFGWYLMRKMDAHDPPLNQSELARQVGVSQSTISRWIYNPGRPDDGKLKPLAKTLGVEYSELLTVAGYGRPADNIADALSGLRPTIDPLAAEIGRMLDPNSPIPDTDRQALRTILDRVIDPHRRQMRTPASRTKRRNSA